MKSERTIEYRKLFNQKNDYILSQPFGMCFQEIFLLDFIDYVFTRNNREEPFEETLSREYLLWRKKKEVWVQRLHEWKKRHDDTEKFPVKINYEDMPFFKYNPIAIEFKDKRGKNGDKIREHTIITKDNIERIDRLEGKKFVIASPITYVGRNRSAKNARYLYAFAFDLDGVGMEQLRDCLYQMQESVLEKENNKKWRHTPVVNIIVNSGHGLHLYYLLNEPIPLFQKNQELLNRLKKKLVNVIWNEFTSKLKDRQYQGIFQGFRLPGTQTKFGERIRAFYNEDSYLHSLEELNVYAGNELTEEEINLLTKNKYNQDRVTLKEAEKRWPEWYERVIIKGIKGKRKWHIKRDLYDWWLRRLKDPGEPVFPGHRYFCIMALATYAIKCDISFEELKEDAFSLVERMEKLTEDEDNHFTLQDAYDALQAYKVGYCTFPKNSIEYLTGLKIGTNRRNGRKQKVHLMLARNQQELLGKIENKNWREGNGRPNVSEKIYMWRRNHPDIKNKSLCAKELGLSRPTVRKWWSLLENPISSNE